jgi:hypothetical protein
MELTGTKHFFVLLALAAPLAISGAVTASAASQSTYYSRHVLYLYVLPAVTVSAARHGTETLSAARHDTGSGWQPYAENTDFSLPPYVPDRFGPLSNTEKTSLQRAVAIHECNIRARRIGAERDWQAATYTLYGVCMSEQHQRFG